MNESLIFSEGILAESSLVFDEGRKLEVVRNVLLAGNRSKNGYDLPPSAFGSSERVKELYEGIPCHVNHRIEHGTSRDVESLAGMVANARLVNGKPRGDILLNDNQAGNELRSVVKLSERAQGKLRNIGLSHVASYRFAPGRQHVESVLNVFSVDLVIGPATTNSLFESTSPPCVPWSAEEALKFLNYPELMHGNWSPHQALELLHRDTGGFDVAEALRQLDVTHHDGFSAEEALKQVSFI